MAMDTVRDFSHYQLKEFRSLVGLENPHEPAEVDPQTGVFEDEYDAEDPESKAFFEEVDEAVTLSRSERLYGFIACFLIGWIISFTSVSTLPSIALNPSRFAVLYSSGNLVSLASTMFLFGPWKQFKSMFEDVRRASTLMYLGSILLTLFCAFRLHSIPLVILSMALQFVRHATTGSLLVVVP